jgi:membrane-associated phospholipid phosphatase
MLMGQGPYVLSWKKEIPLLGVSALLGIPAFVADPGRTTMSGEEIALLDPGDVNALDRPATENWSEQADRLSDIGLYTPAALAAISTLAMPALAGSGTFWKDSYTLGMIWLEANLMGLTGTELVKISVKRVRPYAYNEEIPPEEKEGNDVRKSFFSRTTALSAVNSFFLARVYADYYPESPWRLLTWSLAALVPAGTATMRVRAGRHFTTDVMAGYVLGAALGTFIPWLHKTDRAGKQAELTLAPFMAYGASGLSVHFRF